MNCLSCCSRGSSPTSSGNSHFKTVSAPIGLLSLGIGGVLYFNYEKWAVTSFAISTLVMTLASVYFERIATQGIQNDDLVELRKINEAELQKMEELGKITTENKEVILGAKEILKNLDKRSVENGSTFQRISQAISISLAYLRSSSSNVTVLRESSTLTSQELEKTFRSGERVLTTLRQENTERQRQFDNGDQLV